MKNTRLKVQKILRSVIDEGLNAIGLTGWNVQEFASPQYTSLDKCVLMNLVRVQRLGWQWSNTVDGDRPSSANRKDEWIELEHWQLHVIAKRPTTADENTVVAEDVTDALAAWLNGAGMDMLRRNGVAPERIDGNMILVYNDDNEIYQKRGVFTVKIQVQKELTTGNMHSIDEMTPGIYPV